jgi:hypothetical protein
MVDETEGAYSDGFKVGYQAGKNAASKASVRAVDPVERLTRSRQMRRNVTLDDATWATLSEVQRTVPGCLSLSGAIRHLAVLWETRELA